MKIRLVSRTWFSCESHILALSANISSVGKQSLKVICLEYDLCLLTNLLEGHYDTAEIQDAFESHLPTMYAVDLAVF